MLPKDQTKIGGDAERFPKTRWSAIKAVSSENAQERERAFSTIAEAYWKPIYFYIRMKWQKSNEDAKDLTQAFFAVLLEKEYLNSFNPEKALFRTFLRTCIDRFVMNEIKAAGRIKRGGQVVMKSLDFESANQEWREIAADNAEPDVFFEQEWLRAFFAQSVVALENELKSANKNLYFEIFKLYELEAAPERPSYKSLAARFDLPETKVTNYLAFARRRFREIALKRIRSLTATETEFRQEVRSILGVEAA